MIVQVRGPQFRIRVVPYTGAAPPEDLIRASVRHIRVSRRLGTAAGSFQFTLLPRSTKDWTRLGPMDYCEISLWVPPRAPRVVMRGFVDTVAESFSIQGGMPQRVYIVAGRDYGKLTLNSKLFYLDLERKGLPQELQLFERWQQGFDSLSTGDRYRGTAPAVQQSDSTEQVPTNTGRGAAPYLFTAPQVTAIIFEQFLEPQFEEVEKRFTGGGAPARPGISSIQDDLDEEMVTFSPQYSLQTWQPYTDVWSLFRTYQNAPWRELFWEEEPTGPILYSRPAPWLDEGGRFVSPVFSGHAVVQVPIGLEDIQQMTFSRTDEEVRNYFFTYPGIFSAYLTPVRITGQDLEGMMSDGFLFGENPFLQQSGSSDFRLYGLRLMEVPTQYFDYDGIEQREKIEADWVRMRRVGAKATRRLAAAFGHGESLESGSMTLRGNENIQVGCYLDFGSVPRVAYVEQVQHEFVQGSGQDGRFTTSVGVTRARRLILAPGGTVLDIGGAP